MLRSPTTSLISSQLMEKEGVTSAIFNRPDVAGAVHWVSDPFPPNLQNIITPKLSSELKFWENIHLPPCVTCQVWRVTCHVSHVRCQVSGVFIHVVRPLVVCRHTFEILMLLWPLKMLSFNFSNVLDWTGLDWTFLAPWLTFQAPWLTFPTPW